jgi:hypothetical protein
MSVLVYSAILQSVKGIDNKFGEKLDAPHPEWLVALGQFPMAAVIDYFQLLGVVLTEKGDHFSDQTQKAIFIGDVTFPCWKWEPLFEDISKHLELCFNLASLFPFPADE